MKKFVFLMAVMALFMCCYAQEINLDEALEEQPAVVYNAPVQAPTLTVAPSTTITSAPAKPAVVQPTVAESEIKVQTVSYNQLSPAQKARLSEFARKASYGTLIKTDLDGCTITSVTTVKDVPSRSGRKMTQYVVIYIDKSGQKQGIIMTDNPIVNEGCTPCYIKCMVATPGYHQGDDEAIPNKPKSGENHQISQEL
jgi:PBP1b-binding outer membrane lipoprotein LpoB